MLTCAAPSARNPRPRGRARNSSRAAIRASARPGRARRAPPIARRCAPAACPWRPPSAPGAGCVGRERRQVHDGARVEHAAEVRQPPVGDGRRDEVERRAVEPAASPRVRSRCPQTTRRRVAAAERGAAARGDRGATVARPRDTNTTARTPPGPRATAARTRTGTRRRPTNRATPSVRRTAPSAMRRAASASSVTRSPLRFSHISVAADPRGEQAQPHEQLKADPAGRQHLVCRTHAARPARP